MLGLVSPHDHGEERRLLLPPTADGYPEHGPGAMPPSVERTSGWLVRLPAKLMAGSVMVLPLPVAWPGGLPCPWNRETVDTVACREMGYLSGSLPTRACDPASTLRSRWAVSTCCGDALADRLEDARTDALATLARTRHGPQVVPLEKPQVSGLVEGVGGPIGPRRLPGLTTSLAL